MACRTASVERVADKTVKAKEQIDKLQSMIESQESANKARFYKQIDEHLASAKLTDAREISYTSNIKTEYTSEFSLDRIAGVVTMALKAAKAATNPAYPQAPTSPEAIDAYADVVNSIAEAAKSSSSSAASMAFSMNRLSPGTIAFLYASSINIQDDETFGSEAVTTTAIYYRLMESPRDVELSAALDATRIRVAADLETYKKFIVLQAALVDSLAAGKITFEAYLVLDDKYAKKAAELEKRVKDGTPPAKLAKGVTPEIISIEDVGLSADYKSLVLSAVEKLSGMGDIYNSVVQRNRSRIESGYY
ncbi:hypothetical protein [Chryseobacterium daecheongense]|uniref:Uncharacterized protein n=1 Tax=Chryseobacterium daecheongense TaxID=192389 RepID=A0A3N0W6E8_9FLAO|nr:hypothetical protein [Chryseobacterium daecheongense]ROI00636.1 hypothetical protein EGI05_07070 [Chryseobacterium daecheongense]TDX94381.1 hypothetical protein BCF50_0146 [Chryseobacterium daecheongense]